MRISTKVMVYLLFLNSTSTVLVKSGFASAAGIYPDAGGDMLAAVVMETAKSFEIGGGFGNTLFGLFTAVAQLIDGLIGIVIGGPIFFYNLGVPMWLMTFLFVPSYAIVAIDLAYAYSGRSV